MASSAQRDGSSAKVLDESELRPTTAGREIQASSGGIVEGMTKLLEQLEANSGTSQGAAASSSGGVNRALFRGKLCFLLDCTGSMSAEITAVKEKFAKTISEVHRRFGRKLDVQIAFVGYRDVNGKGRAKNPLSLSQDQR